jgi:hypothetical protein
MERLEKRIIGTKTKYPKYKMDLDFMKHIRMSEKLSRYARLPAIVANQ